MKPLATRLEAQSRRRLGEPVPQIAAALGVSVPTVYAWLRKTDAPPAPRRSRKGIPNRPKPASLAVPLAAPCIACGAPGPHEDTGQHRGEIGVLCWDCF